MNFRTARLDKIATVTTILVTILLGALSVILIIACARDKVVLIGIFLAAGMMSITVSCYFLAPRRCYFAGADFVIEKNIGKKVVIAINDIKAYGRIPDLLKLKPIRTFGNGGYFGYYGIFATRDYGPINCQLTSLKNIVLIQTTRGNYAISPDNPVKFEEYLQARVAGAGGQLQGITPIDRGKIRLASPWILLIPGTIFILVVLMVVILQSALPGRIATHFDFQGNADGWSPKSSLLWHSIIPQAAICFIDIMVFLMMRARHVDQKAPYFMVMIFTLTQLFLMVLTFDIYWFNTHDNHVVPIGYMVSGFVVGFLVLIGFYYRRAKKSI